MYVRFGINRLPAVHIVDRYFKTVAPLGVKNDGSGLDYVIPEGTDIPFMKDWPNAFCVLVTGAGHATKAMEPSQLVTLADKIRVPVVLIGGPDEIETGAWVSRKTRRKVTDLTGKLSIHQSALVISLSSVVITPDTGMMHIAAALGRPVISLWGNTVPEFGMYPYYGAAKVKNRIFEVRPLSCRPCSKIGYRECPRGHFKCIRLLDLDAIADCANAWSSGISSEEF